MLLKLERKNETKSKKFNNLLDIEGGKMVSEELKFMVDDEELENDDDDDDDDDDDWDDEE